MGESVSPVFVIAFMAFAAWAVYSLWLRPEVWTGIVYPSASNLSVFENIGEFDSLAGCLNAAITKVNSFDEPNNADYECGLNCKPSDFDPELMLCEETRDNQ